MLTVFKRINKCIALLEEKEGIKNICFSFNGATFGFVDNSATYVKMSETSHAFSSCLETLLERVEEYCAPTYSIGDRFRRDNGEFMICSAKDGHVILINRNSGGRWDDPFKVKNVMKITKSEMEKGITKFDGFVKI